MSPFLPLLLLRTKLVATRSDEYRYSSTVYGVMGLTLPVSEHQAPGSKTSLLVRKERVRTCQMQTSMTPYVN
jgi:hypothetical protein